MRVSTVTVRHRSAKTSPSLRQDQRLAWIHELLTGTSESLPYRVAGMLLLLYAQPLVRVVTFPTSIIRDNNTGMTITLGTHPTDVPEPFASTIWQHLASRPNLRTGAGSDNPWLFPSTLAGRHLHPGTVMDRLRSLGVNLLGARNRAMGELVLQCPPSLVAEALGYSPQVAFLHATKAPSPGPATPDGASAPHNHHSDHGYRPRRGQGSNTGTRGTRFIHARAYEPPNELSPAQPDEYDQF